MTAVLMLRRSTLISRSPREFCVSSSHKAHIGIGSSNLASQKPFLNKEVPRSNKEGTSFENIDLLGSAIENEQYFITWNETWTYVKRSTDINVLPCLYDVTLKDSSPNTRIVAKGGSQVHEVDNRETYAPVVSN